MDNIQVRTRTREKVNEVSEVKQHIAVNQVKDIDVQKEIDKIYRRPRSKKYMKALMQIDQLTDADKDLMVRVKNQNTGNINVNEQYNADSEQEPEGSLEEFHRRIAGVLNDEIEKEKVLIQKKIQEEQERLNNMIIGIVAKCCIEGCVVHALDSHGDILEHYSMTQMKCLTEQQVRAGEIVLEYAQKHSGQWTSVEIYGNRFVHRNSAGDTIKIYEY